MVNFYLKRAMKGLILTAVAILGVLVAFKFKGLFHKIISIGLAISFLFSWSRNKYMITGSFIVFTLLSIITFIYGQTVKEIDILKKISIITMGFFLTISSISKLFHFPATEVIKFSMIIPIIITLVVFIRERQLTKEMSFMILFSIYAVSELLSLWI